jgi:hypothetical protein
VKRSLCLVLTATALYAFAGTAISDPVDLEAMKRLTSKFDFAIQYGNVEEGKFRLLYTDNKHYVQIYRLEDGYLDLEWKQTTLGSRVTSIFITELYGDGRPMLAISTFGGRILVYDWDGYDLEWENLQDRFKRIDYMVARNIDEDPQEELIFVAEDKLIIYDSLHKTFEWVSQVPVSAKMIKLADVDDDPQLEIILNTGIIFDSKFYNIEFEWDRQFGERFDLFDINGDGIPEIWGEEADQIIRVFDRYAEREIW